MEHSGLFTDWWNTCCFCHSRARSKSDAKGQFGFCFNIDCQAERFVADAVGRVARLSTKFNKGRSE